jgi:hypothetical protein
LPLPWPLYAIDLEASSLEHDSYPIEVGLAVWPARGQPISGWSTLIRPPWDWLQNGQWSRKSSVVHGITQSELAAGLPPFQVARMLNAIAGTQITWCDGGPYDAYWIDRLFKAAGLKESFGPG